MPPEDLDEISFDADEVARISGVEVKTVANWTDRGFADPYHGSWAWKRGRGRARRYTLRDTLRFALMRDLANRYQIPIPLGRRICGASFSDAFSIANGGYLIVEGATESEIGTTWCRDEEELAARLRRLPMRSCLMVNTKTTLNDVICEAEKVRRARTKSEGD